MWQRIKNRIVVALGGRLSLRTVDDLGYHLTVSPWEAVDLLNSAFADDPIAVKALVGHRVACNSKLADHPTVQVGGGVGSPKSKHGVSILGLLNGFFGTDADGWGCIAGIFKLRCRYDPRHEIPDGLNAGDDCPYCGDEIAVCELQEFKVIRLPGGENELVAKYEG
jgi:hypothetical protein